MPAPPTNSPFNPQTTVHFDWHEWLPFFEDSELNERQKQEMIETLWSIVLTFVDLGWDVRPAPQEISGQIPDLRAALAAAVLNSKDTQTEEAL